VLDHGSAIFVWLGSTGSSGAGGWSREALSSAAQGFVEGLASGRLPLPEVRDIAEVCTRNSSVCIWSVICHRED